MKSRVVAAMVGASALVLAACSGSPTNPSVPSQSGPAQSAQSVSIPDTPVGKKAQWVIDILESEEDSTAAEWEPQLDQSFLDQVSAQEVVDIVNTNLRPARPFQVTAYQGNESQSVTTLVGRVGEPFNLTLGLSADGAIVTLLFGPADNPDWVAPTSLEEVRQRLEDFPAQVAALVIKDGKTLIDINSEEAMPLASVFKLYVLLAVTEQIRQGNLSWDEELTVTDDVRSLPSGELQDAPEGATVTVRDAAQKMISISDNTATDMVIKRVGREAVEAAVARSGHSDPSLLRPFLSTKALFAVEWGDDEYAQRWVKGDQAARRALVEEIDSQPLAVTVADVKGEPGWPKGADWFATAQDITAIQTALHELNDEQVRTILSANPGVSADGWKYAAYKGGSSLGVLTGSWLLQNDDTVATIVFLTKSDDPAALSAGEQELFGLAQATIAILAE